MTLTVIVKRVKRSQIGVVGVMEMMEEKTAWSV